MRKIFHSLFPHWVSPPPSQREPTDLERLGALIEKQQRVVFEQQLLLASSESELGSAQLLLESLQNLESSISSKVTYPEIDK